jgi:hypothetical protein
MYRASFFPLHPCQFLWSFFLDDYHSDWGEMEPQCTLLVGFVLVELGLEICFSLAEQALTKKHLSHTSRPQCGFDLHFPDD